MCWTWATGVSSPQKILNPNLEELSVPGMSATTHLGYFSLSFRLLSSPQAELGSVQVELLHYELVAHWRPLFSNSVERVV